MTDMALHFIRPDWLWLLILVPAAWLIQFKKNQQSNAWSKVIAPEFLSLLGGSEAQKVTSNTLLMPLILTLLIVGISGPSWEKKEIPVTQRADNLVIVLDLTLSMYVEDIKPSRVTRAKQKISDLLAMRTEGYTALVAFSGDAHTVTPLSDDAQTILNQLKGLDPSIMPVLGSRPDRAVDIAVSLFENIDTGEGRILLVTDDMDSESQKNINQALANQPFQLSILAVGTEDGGPIPIQSQGYFKDQGRVIIPQLPWNELFEWAQQSDWPISKLTLNDTDLIRLKVLGSPEEAKDSDIERQFDDWEDKGFWLLLLALPLIGLVSRRGVLVSITLVFLLDAQPSYAFSWEELWRTPDQIGQQRADQGDHAGAAQAYESPAHKAYSSYKSQQYEIVEGGESEQSSSQFLYNQANALVHGGKLEDAIAKYDEALAIEPGMEDALFNRDLVKQMLEQQQEQQQNGDGSDQDQQNQDQQQSQDSQNGDQSQQSSQPQDQQSQDQQSQDQQSQNGQSQQQSEEQSAEQSEGQSQEEQNDPEQSPEQSTQQMNESDSQEAQGETSEAFAEGMPTDEETQAFEQWMRRVPDDPSGLLRRKFQQQAQERGRIQEDSGQTLW